MDLCYLTNAPRELSLGGVVFRARSLTLGDLGELLAWLEDRLPPEDDGTPLRFGSEAARLALASTDGLAVVLHLALLSCQPYLTRGDCRALAAGMGEDEVARLHAIAFRRRPNYSRDESGPPAKDLAEVAWGETFEALTQHRAWVYPEVARLTLDQYDFHAARGELAGPDDLAPSEVQAMWERAKASQPTEETAHG